MIDPRLLCHKCHSCKAGNDHTCEMLGFMGINGPAGGGGLSEFVAVDEDMIYPLPSNVSVDFAALIEPLAVAYHALRVANIKLKGLDTLVIGGGPVGYAVASALKAENVKSVLISEPTVKRRDQAKDLVDKIFDPKSDDVVEGCQQFTGGKGVDVVFDCAGVQAGLQASFGALVRGGTYVNVAVWETPVRRSHMFVVSESN